MRQREIDVFDMAPPRPAEESALIVHGEDGFAGCEVMLDLLPGVSFRERRHLEIRRALRFAERGEAVVGSQVAIGDTTLLETLAPHVSPALANALRIGWTATGYVYSDRIWSSVLNHGDHVDLDQNLGHRETVDNQPGAARVHPLYMPTDGAIDGLAVGAVQDEGMNFANVAA